MHHRLTRYTIIATIYMPSHRVHKLMGHGSTPSDPWPMWPIRFSWPIWPMTHDPSTHSLLCFSNPTIKQQIEVLVRLVSAVNMSIISWFSIGWRPRWPMGHGSHGSWVKSSMGHLGHGSLWVTHSVLWFWLWPPCVADADTMHNNSDFKTDENYPAIISNFKIFWTGEDRYWNFCLSNKTTSI